MERKYNIPEYARTNQQKNYRGRGRAFLRGWLTQTLSGQSHHVLPRVTMHTIADARRLIPGAQKLPVLLSRESRRSHGIDQKPLECAASLASKKEGGCAYSFGELDHRV